MRAWRDALSTGKHLRDGGGRGNDSNACRVGVGHVDRFRPGLAVGGPKLLSAQPQHELGLLTQTARGVTRHAAVGVQKAERRGSLTAVVFGQLDAGVGRRVAEESGRGESVQRQALGRR